MTFKRTTTALMAATATACAALPATAGAAAHHVSSLDRQYLKSAMQGDRFEIAGGALAQTHSSDPQVRALGARLLADHRRSLTESRRIARYLGIGRPAKPTPSQEWELSALATMHGAAFDRWYTTLEVQDHKQDIDEAKNEVDEGLHFLVRRSAKGELPTLRMHLRLSARAMPPRR